MTPNDVDAAARHLEHQQPEEILAWAADRFAPRITFATGFGAEGCVLVDIIGRLRLPVSLFTLDTGLLFPETYKLWRQLEDRYGVVIRGITPELTVDEQEAAYGPDLWARDPDRCCAIRKVAPLAPALAGNDAWVTAIRRDQTAERAQARVVEPDTRFGLVKINPLVRWSDDQVWNYLRAHDVPFNALHERGYPSIGCFPCTTAVRPGEAPRSGRWRNREKKECGLHSRPLAGQLGGAAARTWQLEAVQG